MNKPVQRIDADLIVSISDLKKNPSAAIESAQDGAVAVLNHNKVTAYLISPLVYEYMVDALDDLNIIGIINERQHEEGIPVTLDDL